MNNELAFEETNDVVLILQEIIRCKDCKYRGEAECPMRYDEYIEYDDGDGYMEADWIEHDNTDDNGFCHKGEKRNVT